MTFPVYEKQDLADYSGRPVASFPPFATRALLQAVLLFQASTCLTAMPEDAFEASLAKEAILSMADDLLLSQPFKQAKASPFNSESIGSYSYSKTAGNAASASTKVASGQPTGVDFFDLAVNKLSVCGMNGSTVPSGGGIEAFEWDGPRVQGEGNNTRLVSPRELNLFSDFWVNSDEHRG